MSLAVEERVSLHKCDRCGNKHRLWHGMETWNLIYSQGGLPTLNENDKRSFCSSLCAKAVFEEERMSVVGA